MANAPSSNASPAVHPEANDLNLLVNWPAKRTGLQWAAIILASLAIDAVVFTAAVQIPEFVSHNAPNRRVIVKRTPLYLPRDLLTQRAPNRSKAVTQVNLSDLLSLQAAQAHQSAPKPSARRFEVPKQAVQQTAKVAPQVLAQAPNISVNQAPGTLPPGAQSGLTAQAPPPPTPPKNPFQNIGAEPLPNSKPTLAPPKATVQAAINGLAHDSNSRRLVVSDDNQSQPLPGSPGSSNQLGSKSAVELQSDPEGADMRPYLIRILAIVRANWRRVIPESARLGTIRGRTVVQFIVNRDGSIPKIVMADPSGSDPLDRAALAGLSMSNPLPPLPGDFKGFTARLAFTFTYNMPE